METERITQLIPASPGFYARYTQPGEPDTFVPIASWALLEDADGTQRVVGVDVVGLGGDSWTPDLIAGNLAEYVHSHKPIDPNGRPLA